MGSEPTSAIFRALPIFVSAYTCQQNVFSILTELESPTRDRKLTVRPRELSHLVPTLKLHPPHRSHCATKHTG